MMERTSLIKQLGLESFTIVLLTFFLILLLAPYLSGENFGIFRIPEVTRRAQKWLRVLGPVLFLIGVLACVPLFNTQEGRVDIINANLYADGFKEKRWQLFVPAEHCKDPQFWIGFRVTAKGDIDIDRVEVGHIDYPSFNSGDRPETKTDDRPMTNSADCWDAGSVDGLDEERTRERLCLKNGQSVYLSVCVEKKDWSQMFNMLNAKTRITVFNTTGNEIGFVEIARRDLNCLDQ